MSDDNPMILNNPISVSDPSTEASKEIFLKENFNDELANSLLNKESFDIILPDDLKIKEKKKQR